MDYKMIFYEIYVRIYEQFAYRTYNQKRISYMRKNERNYNGTFDWYRDQAKEKRFNEEKKVF